ncbi:MAG: peptidylprolyl isomerase [Phycisphaerae bacterium]|nr:peptidylprolyl isomerase [Phycisphaerae bacterium]
MIRLLVLIVSLAAAIPSVAQTTSPTTPPPTRRSFDKRPDMKIDKDKKYIATIDTDKGQIVCELYPKDAPQTVNSFVFLAKEHFYDGLTFHRVVQDFVIQGGDPSGDGTGGPGYTLPLEVEGAQHTHVKGALAMARTQDPNSAGSQFYITLAPTPQLDGQYTVFGKVTSGQDVVDKIAVGDKIKSIAIEEK